MKNRLLILGLITVLCATFACERKGVKTLSNNDGPILIGYYGDLSGRTSNFGLSTKNGVLMATDEINQAGGINGRKIQIIVEDDQGRPEQAATVVTKLINQDRVHAIIGEVASGNTLAAAPKSQAAKIPMITPSSTAESITKVGDYIFRVCYSDNFQGIAMVKFAANTLKAKRAAILLDFNSPYSRGLTEVFKENFAKVGGEVVTEQAYTQGDRDYKGQLTSIRSANPDVIFIPGYYGEVGVIAKQAKQLGITQPLLGVDGWDAPQLFELGGDSLNGSYMANHYSVDDPAPAVQKFIGDYKAKYNGVVPDALAALGYDSMLVLADALRRAGTTDEPKLRDAIAQTSNFAGVTGVISINEERNAVKPIVVLKLENGKYIYQETIQPSGVTATNTAPSNPTTQSIASPTATNTSSASSTFVQQLINGLTIGAIYALIALGYTMVYGILRLINFAHGDIYMVGAFAGYFLALQLGTLTGGSLLGLGVVLLSSMIVAALIGIIIERFIYRPVRKYARMTTLITAIGVSLLIENLFVARFGGAPRAFPQLLNEQSYTLFGNAAVSKSQLLIFAVSFALMLLLQWVIYKTKIGTAMRAVSFNLNSAKLMGVNTNMVIAFTFALGSALAAAGGVLTAQYNPQIDPLMGILTGLKGFVAAVLGGIGNIPGAVLGGLLIGAAETFVVGYGQQVGIPTTFRDAVAFSILILILLFRPTGLLGSTVQEKV